MPISHQKQLWSPERLIGWGANIGPGTRALVEHLLKSKPHPEQAYKACLGLLSLERKYTGLRLEKACQQALLLNRPNRATVANLLQNKREEQKIDADQQTSPLQHSNIRGANYYN
jgi:Tfp pilus assembly protein FimV